MGIGMGAGMEACMSLGLSGTWLRLTMGVVTNIVGLAIRGLASRSTLGITFTADAIAAAVVSLC